MTRTGNILLCILLGVPMTTYAQDPCPYKECECSVPEIYCNDHGLTSFPTLSTFYLEGFTNLLLTGNEITNVPGRRLPANLTDISLMNNPILTMDDTAFEGSTATVKSIAISNALFTRIPNAFQHLQGLRYLSIYDTPIQDWNNDAMKSIGPTVMTLDLQQVGLNAWPSWFQYFTSVTELILDGTNISSIPDDAFDNLVNILQGLTISNGDLTAVPRALNGLLKLESLNLEFNKIVDVKCIPQMSKLSAIALDNNKIANASELSAALKPFAGSLTSLEIQHNELTVFPDLSFFEQIGSLDFSHNRIYDPSSGGVPPYLYTLVMGHNLLPTIPSLWKSLQLATSLVLPYNSVTKIIATDFHLSTFEVDLSYNLITEFTVECFPQNSSIRMMYFNNNPISFISEDAFTNLGKLMTLDLQETRIARLPLALTSLTSLGSLDMSNSVHLVCTCAEKALTSWVLSVTEVKGNCTIISIQEFFRKLSPFCPDG